MAQQVATAFDPRPVITALLTLGLALLGALVGHWQTAERERKEQARLHRLLAVNPEERPEEADAVALGVFPGRRRRRTPPYVTREIDEAVRESVAAGCSVVVTGPPLAGKSRTALEAVRAVAPDATLIAPRGPDELKTLLAADPRLHVPRAHRILWLDDLPQYAESLDHAALERLTEYFPPPYGHDDARIAVVATVRDDEWTKMLGSTGSAGQLARGLADRASVHRLKSTDPVFEAAVKSIAAYADETFPDGPGRALATTGMEVDPPEPPRKPFEPSGPARWDTTAKLLAGGTGLAAAVLVLVLVTAGFSTPQPPPVATQIAALQRRAAEDGQYVREVVRSAVDLHGTGQESHVFTVTVVSPRPGEPTPSEELRVYDVDDGWLRLVYRFRPADAGVKFEPRGAHDIDGDGAAEIVGGLAAPDARYAMLPVAIDWQSFRQRYALVALDVGPPGLSDVRLPKRFRIAARQYRDKYAAAVTIRDDMSSQRVTGHRVQDFIVTAPQRLVAAYFLRPPFDMTKDKALYELHAAVLTVGRAPSLRPCAFTSGPPPQMEILLAERSQTRAVAETWAAATANRYCAVVIRR
ncbi:MAG TPA: hypothetical protein VFZ00_14830 [Solirubrobacter sp.]|nr:hypothetical protein [Solirubrobacter sp.]